MSSVSLPALPRYDNLEKLEAPSPRIRTDEDVATWKQTTGYKNYMLFLRRLSESVVNHYLPVDEQATGPNMKKMLAMLDRLDVWIDEIPPLPTPQRFGNLAFRTWGQRLEDNGDELLKQLLPESMHACVQLLKPYLVISFGSFVRMDYGTGHEAAFGILLLCLSLIRFFHPEPAEERQVVLVVFMRYLRLCWKLQDVYRLEPAGSHGVWGLDDSSFLGYIFGSGQLRDQTDIPVNAVLRPNLPPTNLYFLSILRIHQVKQGPFHEHSSQLYAIAVGVPNWGKVHSGLFKMYEAEVLGKRVVVQHIPVGGLLEWDERFSRQPTALRTAPPSSSTHTGAPWAVGRSHLPHSISYTPAIPPTSFHRPTVRPVAPPVLSALTTRSTGSLGPLSADALPGNRFTQSVAAQETPTITPEHENDSAEGSNRNGSNDGR